VLHEGIREVNETRVKQSIARNIRMEGGYARRIEDQFSVGMPDLILIPIGCPVVWAEVKMIVGYTFRPTERQFLELQRLNIPPHSISVMIGFKNDRHYVSIPRRTVRIEDCIEQEDGESIGRLIKRALETWYLIKQ
jgi:hypothetical protein